MGPLWEARASKAGIDGYSPGAYQPARVHRDMNRLRNLGRSIAYALWPPYRRAVRGEVAIAQLTDYLDAKIEASITLEEALQAIHGGKYPKGMHQYEREHRN